MSQFKVVERSEIREEDKWDLSTIYKTSEDWEESFERMMEEAPKKVKAFEGRLGTSAKVLKEALDVYLSCIREINKLYVYASMSSDEDTRDGEKLERNSRAGSLWVKFAGAASYMEPEILSLDQKTIETFMEENAGLRLYRHYLDEMMKQKAHVLSEKEEAIMAAFGEVNGIPSNVYGILKSADLKFPTVTLSTGDVQITDSNLVPLLQGRNRADREIVYKAFYDRLGAFTRTMAATLDGQVRVNITNARIRKYASAREAALSGNSIPESVYDALVSAVNENLSVMHRYMDVRRKALGLEKLEMYDIYTPIVDDIDMNIPFDEAVEIIKEALKPLGEEYGRIMAEGFQNRWVDRYENTGKRGGAYSGGSYDTNPFILISYHGTLGDVFTLAHEMGHSMHSYLTRHNQPFVYGDYPIFLAEIASTCHETLLMNYLLDHEKDPERLKFIMNHYLESLRMTLYRQTQFAEFEHEIHKYVEEGGALTAEFLSKLYGDINARYYGDNMITGPEIAMEWARIPHFYYNYYVYQYATGISAATAFAKKILEGGEKEREAYLEFLKAGSSDYAIETLKKAGVDVTTPQPVSDCLELFKHYVEIFEKEFEK